MGRIFISYRRDDSQDMTERIHDRLVRDLKEHQIFLDVERNAIPGAAHYKDVLTEYAQNCDVLIAIIGTKWLTIKDPLTDLRRLDNPDDFVRIEVGTALASDRAKVIPVFIHNAKVPHPTELPDPLKGLLELQVVKIRNNPDFHQDIDNLLKVIHYYLPPKTGISPRLFIASLVMTALLAIGITYWLFGRPNDTANELATVNPSAIAVQLLTEIAQTNQAPTATPTTDVTLTIQAIMQDISTREAQTLIAQAPSATLMATMTPRPTDTATPSPSPTPNLAATQRIAATAEAVEAQATVGAMVQAATQNSQLLENQLTNTPQPTMTPTNSPSPTATATLTPSATATATVNLAATERANLAATASQVAVATQVYEQAVATFDAQFTATAVAFLNQRYGDVLYHRNINTREIFSINLDGSSEQNLTTNGADDMRPQWSPDGSWVVFDSYRNGQRDLYLMRPDGSEERQLTNDARVDFAPMWSPDGAQVIYYAYESVESQETNIYTVDINSQAIQQLTDTTTGNSNPSWSPDGSQIVFTTRRDNSWYLYSMNADGSDQRSLFDPPISGISPRWSPTRDELIYASTIGGNFELYRINIDGSDKLRLTENSGENRNPSWSSDGNWIVFDSTLSGNGDIYVIDRDGNHLTQVTFTTGDEAAPTWNPFVSVSEAFLERPQCEGFLPSRLKVGGQARVISQNESVNMRQSPSVAAPIITQLAYDSVLPILDGAVCADTLAWWEVEINGQTGWIAEGRLTEYWLEPAQ